MRLRTQLCEQLFRVPAFASLSVCPEVELLSRVMAVCLVFGGAPVLLSQASALFHFPLAVQRLQCLHILANTCFLFSC